MSAIRFINRTRELESLERAWRSGRAELVILRGRRRIGKSRLLARFAENKPIAYMVAAQRLRTSQLGDAERDIARFANGFRPGRPPALRLDDWDAFLATLEASATRRRVGVIIDEFPYLVAESPELPSLIQRWWDRIRDRSHLFLVLAGSDQALMRDLVGGTGALFGRATLQPQLQPLDYFEAAKFVRRWGPEDRIRTYAVAGGVPEYLRLFDDTSSFRENLTRLAFDPDGLLFREADYLLEAEFREVSRRGSIFRAMATGSVRPNEIAQAIGLGSAADVLPNLRDLVNLGLVERVVPIDERGNLRSRRVAYRIADGYLRFYFSIVDPRRALITLGRADAVNLSVSDEELDAFVSRTFEDVARQYIWRLPFDRLGGIPDGVGTWWSGPEEVDIVVVRGNHVLAAGEAKWQRSAMSEGDLATLDRRVQLLDPDAADLRFLVSRSGVAASLRRRPNVVVVTPRDLFSRSLEVAGPPVAIRPVAARTAPSPGRQATMTRKQRATREREAGA